METLRRKFKVTLEEEEQLAAIIDGMLCNLYEANRERKVREAVESLLNRGHMDGDYYHINYSQGISDGTLVAYLGEIRKSQAKAKRDALGRFKKV